MDIVKPPNSERNKKSRPVYTFSGVVNVRDRSPKERSGTLEAIAGKLHKHGERFDAKDGPAFIGATFDGAGRTADNVKAVTWLTLDIEETSGTVDGLQGPLTGFRRIVYSTRSHGVPGKWSPEQPRFRVLAPYSRPVTPAEHRAIFSHVYELLDGAPDPATKDPGRLQFTPRAPHPDAQREPFFDTFGDLPELNPDALPDGDGGTVAVGELVEASNTDTAERSPNYRTPDNLADSWIPDALEAIDPDVGYETWRNIGTALRSTFGDDALELFIQWSSGGDEYDGPLVCRSYWQSFPETPPDSVDGGAVTLGTIWHHAKQADWTPPEDAYQGRTRPGPEMLDPYDGAEPIDLDTGRARLAEHVTELLDADTGRMFIVADPGSGKTYVGLDAIIDTFQRGETARYMSLTNDVLKEKQADLLERARQREGVDFNAVADAITTEPKRTEKKCKRFDVYRAAERAAEGGGARFCHSCELHPDNMPDKSRQCKFIHQRREQRGGAIQFTTHHLETLKRGRPIGHEDDERGEQIAWSQILRTFIEAEHLAIFDDEPARFHPVARRTPKLWRLEARRRDAGAWPPELLEGVHYTTEDGEHRERYKPTAEGRRTILRWLADCAGGAVSTAGDPDRDALFHYYRTQAAERECSLAVVDESCLSAVYDEMRVTLPELTRWRQNNDLDGPKGWFGQFVEAMVEPVSTPEAVADRLPSGLEWNGNNTGEGLLSDALAETSDDVKAKCLEGAPDWRALHALEYWSQRGWLGCYIAELDEGDDARLELVMPYPHTLDLDGADRVLALDATGDPVAAEAIFGPNVDYRVVKVQRPDTSTVQRVDWQLTPPRSDEDSSTLDVKRHETLLRSDRFKRGEHLHVTRKDFNPNVDYCERSADKSNAVKAERERHVRATERAAGDDTNIIHVGGTKARGSNEFEGAESATVASYYVPSGPIEQRAAVLEARTRYNTAECRRAAIWQLEGAEVVQAAHRARLLNGDTLVTYCDTREIPGLESDRVVDRPTFDGIAAMTTGHFRDWNTDRPAAELLRTLVDFAGGTAIAGSASNGAECGAVSDYTLTSHIGPLCGVRVYLDTDVKNALNTAFKNRWNGSWAKAVDAAGLESVRLRTDRGGRGVVILSTAPLDADAVREFIDEVSPDWRWYELDGERVTLDDGLDDIRDAVATIGAGWLEWTARQKRDAIGERIGCSASTVARRLREADAVDAMTPWLDDAWRAAHLDDTEPATVTRITVDPEGMNTVELVARKAARDLRLAIDDVEDTLADCVEGADGLHPTTHATDDDAEAETTTDDYRCPYGETWKQRCARAMDRSLRVLANAQHVQRWRVELERQWRRDCRIWELANADTPDFLDYLRDHDAPTWLVVGLHLAIDADDPIRGAAAYPDAPWPEAVPAIPVAIPSMRTTHRGTPRPG